jgi:hypothetical protein
MERVGGSAKRDATARPGDRVDEPPIAFLCSLDSRAFTCNRTSELRTRWNESEDRQSARPRLGQVTASMNRSSPFSAHSTRTLSHATGPASFVGDERSRRVREARCHGSTRGGADRNRLPVLLCSPLAEGFHVQQRPSFTCDGSNSSQRQSAVPGFDQGPSRTSHPHVSRLTPLATLTCNRTRFARMARSHRVGTAR